MDCECLFVCLFVCLIKPHSPNSLPIKDDARNNGHTELADLLQSYDDMRDAAKNAESTVAAVCALLQNHPQWNPALVFLFLPDPALFRVDDAMAQVQADMLAFCALLVRRLENKSEMPRIRLKMGYRFMKFHILTFLRVPRQLRERGEQIRLYAGIRHMMNAIKEDDGARVRELVQTRGVNVNQKMVNHLVLNGTLLLLLLLLIWMRVCHCNC